MNLRIAPKTFYVFPITTTFIQLKRYLVYFLNFLNYDINFEWLGNVYHFKSPAFDFLFLKLCEKYARIHLPRWIRKQPKITIVIGLMIWFPHCLNNFSHENYHRRLVFSTSWLNCDECFIFSVRTSCYLSKESTIKKYFEADWNKSGIKIFVHHICLKSQKLKLYENAVDTFLEKTLSGYIFVGRGIFSSRKSTAMLDIFS